MTKPRSNRKPATIVDEIYAIFMSTLFSIPNLEDAWQFVVALHDNTPEDAALYSIISALHDILEVCIFGVDADEVITKKVEYVWEKRAESGKSITTHNGVNANPTPHRTTAAACARAQWERYKTAARYGSILQDFRDLLLRFAVQNIITNDGDVTDTEDIFLALSELAPHSLSATTDKVWLALGRLSADKPDPNDSPSVKAIAKSIHARLRRRNHVLVSDAD